MEQNLVKPRSVFSVAYWFVNVESCDSKKLQKLCYYMQAWSYAINDGPFFEGDFEAWVHGPINRELWERIKSIAWKAITVNDFSAADKVDFSEQETRLLQLVWDTYGEFSGFELETLTRNELPWQEQRVGLDVLEAGTNIIRPETMKNYYRNMISCDEIEEIKNWIFQKAEHAKSDERPIGIFDSGVGGLSAICELQKLLPNENIIYFGDTARLPYGSKNKEEIKQYAREAVDLLLSKNVKVILAACGTVSSIALDDIKKMVDIPVYGIIDEAAKKACEMTKADRIGVIGTQATINAGKFEYEIKKIKPEASILGIPCPLFVSLVERDIVSKGEDALQKACEVYLSGFRGNVDTLILGCTHFSHIREAIEEFLPGIIIVDPVEETVKKIAEDIKEKEMTSIFPSQTSAEFFVSGDPERFAEVGKMLMNAEIEVRRKETCVSVSQA